MQSKEQITSSRNHLPPMAFFMFERFSCSVFYLLYLYLSVNIIVRDLTIAINRAQVSKA